MKRLIRNPNSKKFSLVDLPPNLIITSDSVQTSFCKTKTNSYIEFTPHGVVKKTVTTSI